MLSIVRPTRGRAVPGIAVAAVFTLASVVTGGFVAVPAAPPLDPAVGLAVPLALLFGAVAAPGVAAGVVFTAAIRSTLSWWTVVDAVSWFVLAATAYRLWGALPVVSTGDDPSLRSVRQWLEFAAVTVLAGLTAVAVLAWGSVILWGGSFHAVVFSELPIVLASSLAVGPAAIYPVASLFDDRVTTYRDRGRIEVGSGAFRGAVVTPVAWVVVGVLTSLVVGLVQLVGGATLERHGYGRAFAPFDPDLIGYGGRRLQILVGALMLSLVVATYLPSRRDVRTDRSPSPSTRS